MIRIGTNHFMSFASAVRYFRAQYGNDASIEVVRKLREGEIVLGRPKVKDGERAVLIDNGQRWAIESEER